MGTNLENLQVVSNRVRNITAGNGGLESVASVSAPADQYIQATLATFNAASAGTLALQLLLRIAAPPTQTYYEVDFVRNTGAAYRVEIYSTVAGVAVLIISTTVPIFQAGDICLAVLKDFHFWIYLNKTLVIDTTEAVGTIATGGAGLGIYMNAAGTVGEVEADDYSMGALQPFLLVRP